ncbi:hypothetical protein BOX15_Mlig012614g2, partial [Macrostomum lignano]
YDKNKNHYNIEVMLDLEVQPERGLFCPKQNWELILGMPLHQAINILRQADSDVRSVQLWYSDRLPLLMDIVLSLTQDGVKLIFDATYQRLKSIEVFDLTKLQLSYCNQSFNSPPGVAPTVTTIQQCFGATHPAVHDPERDADVLSFRGVSFTFPRTESSSTRSTIDDGSGSFSYYATFEESDEVPCLVPSASAGGPSVQANAMFIFLGNSLSEPRLPQQMPLDCYQTDKIYLERARIDRSASPAGGGGGQQTREIVFQLYCLEPPATASGSGQCTLQRCDFERRLRFGDSVQDVESSLGSPSQVFYKSEDKMRIHARDPARRRPRTKRSDYIYNYFTMGVDLLFDGLSHSLVKAILHTNFPGHYNFSTYYRCFFDLTVQQESGQQPLEVNQFTRWEEISDCLGKQSDRPVVLNRHDSTNTVNPFGPTYCYGHEDLIFEVIPCNGQLASLTVYQNAG